MNYDIAYQSKDKGFNNHTSFEDLGRYAMSAHNSIILKEHMTLPWIGRVGLCKAFVTVCYKMYIKG